MRIDAKLLMSTLTGASRIASKEKYLPAMCVVSIRTDKNALWFESTNRFHAIRTKIYTKDVPEDVRVSIPTEAIKPLVAELKKLPKHTMVDVVIGEQTVKVDLGESVYEVPTLNADFPNLSMLFQTTKYENKDGQTSIGLSMEYLGELAKIDKGAWKFEIEHNRIRATSVANDDTTPQWEYLLMCTRLAG